MEQQQVPKIYVGNGVEKFDGDVVEFALNLSKLKEAGEHVFEFNGQKYIKLKVCKNREGVNQYGKTHYVEVNTFKPEPKEAPTQNQAAPMPVASVEGFDDDIPF